jgi:hypothetical protein
VVDLALLAAEVAVLAGWQDSCFALLAAGAAAAAAALIAVLMQKWSKALFAHQQLLVLAWVPQLQQHLVLLAVFSLVLRCSALLLVLQVPPAVFLSFLVLE